jgi:hypothetical protein
MNYFSTKYKINDVFSDFHSKKGFILRRMQLAGNVSAMVSTGLKGADLSVKHLAKAFYFVLSFHFKATSKDLADLV